MAFVWIVQRRIRPRGMRTARETWETVAAFATHREAEACAAELPAALYGARVERVEVRGELAELMEPKPELRATG